MAILVILLWTATLCTWYAVKTTPPRYLKSSQLILDTKENKFYHYSYRRWMPCTVPYAEHPHPQDIQWQYLEEITGYSAEQYKSINNNISANTIIQGLDQNKFTIQELRDAVAKFNWTRYKHLMGPSDDDDSPNPLLRGITRMKKAKQYINSHRSEIIESINNASIRELFE